MLPRAFIEIPRKGQTVFIPVLWIERVETLKSDDSDSVIAGALQARVSYRRSEDSGVEILDSVLSPDEIHGAVKDAMALQLKYYQDY